MSGDTRFTEHSKVSSAGRPETLSGKLFLTSRVQIEPSLLLPTILVATAASTMDLSDNRKAAIAALLGLSSSTCFYSMNTTINYLTMPTIMLGRPPTSPSQQGPFFVSSVAEPLSSHSHLVRQHQEILIRGGKYGAPSTIFSALTLLTAAYYSPSDSIQRKLYGLAGAISFVVFPATLVFIVPTNKKLTEMSQTMSEQMRNGADSKDAGENARAMELLKKWTQLSKIRAATAMVASVLVVTALAS
jgi:hypothetical protein